MRMIGTSAVLGFFVWTCMATAQEMAANVMTATPASTMEMTIVGTSLKGTDGKIWVNQSCEIFPGLQFPMTGKKIPQGELDSAVCHLESVLQSGHREEEAVGSELERRNVEVREREYVLGNITLKPVVFAILEDIPEGWRVDSDPQPARTIPGKGVDLAIFEVHAEPGETVRLHVGMRHSKELKPKALPATGASIP